MTLAWPTPLHFGPWLLDARLGLGGTSEVWRARHVDKPGEFALKRLLPIFRDDATVNALFHRETRLLQLLDSPRLPRLLARGTCNDIPWLAMPLYAGASLRALLHDGPMSTHEAYWLAAELAEALADLHAAGVVHCDVSPGNVQITRDGQVVLLDLGIAQRLGADEPLDTLALRGKSPYLSPEQVARQPLDARSDLFALGSVLVELLTGTPPFARPERSATLAAVLAVAWQGPMRLPEAVRPLVVALLAAVPGQRADSARALARQLRGLVADVPRARAQVIARVAAVPLRVEAPIWQAAELRGEPVTNPGMDAGATVAER